MSEYKPEKVVGEWLRRFAVAAVLGAVEFAMFIVIFYWLLPYAIQELVPGFEPEPRQGYPVIIVAMLLLSVAARALRGTPLNPVFRSSMVLLGLILTVSIVGMGELRVDGLDIGGGAKLSLYIDLTPLYEIIFLFMILPTIAFIFINYFLGEAEG